MYPERWRTVLAMSPSKARYEYWLRLRDPWPEAKLIDIRSRVIALTAEDEDVDRIAKYRMVPARIAMRVELEGKVGYIVGANSSANLDVIFPGHYGDHPVNCHPNWKMRYFNDKGEEIYSCLTAKA